MSLSASRCDIRYFNGAERHMDGMVHYQTRSLGKKSHHYSIDISSENTYYYARLGRIGPTSDVRALMALFAPQQASDIE